MNDIQLGFQFVTTAVELQPPKAEKVRRKTARQARDEGVNLARIGAGETWIEKAVNWVKVYAEKHDEFMCEAARAHAESFGFAEPPTKRAWGPVMQLAADAGYVKKIGLSYATDPKVHMNSAGLWKSLIYKGPV